MNDEEYGRLLLAPLAGDPPEPGAVDVPKAMRDGRRRRRRRTWTGLFAAVIAASVGGGLLLGPAELNKPGPDLPPEPKLPTSCTATRLPLGRWTGAELQGGDSSGRWQVGVSDPVDGGDNRMLVWHDGKLVAEAPKRYAGIWMNDINTSGLAVGRRVGGNDLPFAYQDGTFTQLKGGSGNAVVVNDNGIIAGVLLRGNQWQAARWSYPGAEPELLTMPAGQVQMGDVVGIEPDGTVVGTARDDSYEWLPDGTVRHVPPPSLPGATHVGTNTVMYRFGWIYAMVANDNAPRPSLGPDGPSYTDLYRYEPRSGTWQHLYGDTRGPQLVGNGTYARVAQGEPSVWIGKRVFQLSARPAGVAATGKTYELRAMSADSSVMAGTMGGTGDHSVPFIPIIWRCG